MVTANEHETCKKFPKYSTLITNKAIYLFLYISLHFRKINVINILFTITVIIYDE